MKYKKGDIELSMLAWWLLAAAILIIGAAAYFYFTGKGLGAIEFIKNLLRFGR